MSNNAKHASGKTDFELVEAAIDVAVNGADLHEDDEECPQDDTCECRDAAIVNDGHRALVRMDREIASLSEQVRALTAERGEARNRIDRAMHVLDTGKHFVHRRVRNVLAGEAAGKDVVPMVRAEVVDALRARVAELETSVERLRETVRKREAAELEALAEADELRARLAEVEAERDAYCDSLMETAHFYMEWALKDGNSPGYNIAKARTYGDKANEYRIRAEKAERERDEARAQVATARAAGIHEAADRIKAVWWQCTSIANDVRALATTPPPPVVPVAKVREVLQRIGRDVYTAPVPYVIQKAAESLGISLDGET